MVRVWLEPQDPFFDEEIDDALHALPRHPHSSRDLGNRACQFSSGPNDLPSGLRLPHRGSQGRAMTEQRAVETKHLEHKRAEGVRGGVLRQTAATRSRRWDLASIWHSDIIMSY